MNSLFVASLLAANESLGQAAPREELGEGDLAELIAVAVRLCPASETRQRRERGTLA